MSERATPEQLAEEAAKWDKEAERLLTPISIRLPDDMLVLIREFARRKGVGYQVLMKQWLDDRVKEEAKKFLAKQLKEGEGV